MTAFLSHYANKQLNQIVFPGSHDAGIYGQGKSNVITQSLDIAGQANAGVRFFDMRIATVKRSDGSFDQKSYHLAKGVIDNKHKGARPGEAQSHQNVGHLGGWGQDTLTDMLTQAKTYVAANPSEFLILKFSKCYNLKDVVDTCVRVLGDTQFNHNTSGGAKINLNTRTVGSLAGKVITLFDPKELEKLGPVINGQIYSGCLSFGELFDKETGASRQYQKDFHGLQYFGKFSSTDDIKKNTKKQAKQMGSGVTCDRDAMGMMYWTTTGMLASIKDRNDKMWSGVNVQALRDVWEAGYKKAMMNQLGALSFKDLYRSNSHLYVANKNRWTSFTPNIVMIDFADYQKCVTIYNLNRVRNEMLETLMQQSGHAIEGL
ncbi:hypothetical protein [Roseateles saccharophilus]|uniref:Phosphatidylinositol diacylglycerol-lyase n=1 Tax=Roseateles saccharophilus TaxID=304 RepID=A0A4R3UZQ0_ROSSA|nr:hypothetical protein [Roseateles saccharophilus]MDG0833099.1 hypothetical protein [Roseateles saccharophilus]TCU96298.1 hypothetical protein EV671_101365 [Roseateles saccharophilus]